MPEQQQVNAIPLDTVRLRLALIWYIGAPAILMLVIWQTFREYYDKPADVFAWLMPTVLPNLGLITTVLAYTALDPKHLDAVVRKSFYYITAALSTFYLILVFFTLLAASTPLSPMPALDLLHMSNLWIGPIQGIVSGALGILFVTKKDNQAPAPQSAAASTSHG